MASNKRPLEDDESGEEVVGNVDVVTESGAGKKIKSDENGSAQLESMESSAAIQVRVAEVTNETLTVEWTSPTAGKSFVVTLESNINLDKEPQSRDCKANEGKECSVEFTGLKPLTQYKLTVCATEKGESPVPVEVMTTPSLEMPEIEEVQEGCAHLTLAPLPEEESKDVEAYLLLVQPLEDAKDFPAAEMKDSDLQLKLERLVKPPFYLAYEFSQENLEAEEGGQVKVGSGVAKKSGRYGALQDPKLTSGGFYKAVLVVIMKKEGEQTIFAKESCRMLVK